MFAYEKGVEWLVHAPVLSPQEHYNFIQNGMELVAEADGTLVGFIAAMPFQSVLHIYELSVACPWQKGGIGAALLNALIFHAQNNDFSKITLTTFADLAFNAPFYKRYGFQPLQNLPDYIVELLKKEREQGLPVARRIAMIWAHSQENSGEQGKKYGASS